MKVTLQEQHAAGAASLVGKVSGGKGGVRPPHAADHQLVRLPTVIELMFSVC